MSKLLQITMALCLLGSQSAIALSRFQELTIVFDTTVATSAGPVSRQDGLEQVKSGSLGILELAIAPTVQVEALDRTSEGVLLVPDITTEVFGIEVSPRDVLGMAIDSPPWIAFSAESIGLEPPARIVAIDAFGEGLLFVVSSATELNGIVIGPRDIAYFDGQQTTILIAADTLGIEGTAKITALESSVQGNVVFSIRGGALSGYPRAESGALFVYHSDTGDIRQVEPASNTEGSCASCKLRAIAGTLDEDVIFQSNFNSLEVR